MAFSNPTNFRVDRSTFNDVQGDYNQRIQWDFNQQINIHGDQDIRNRLYSIMKNHICTAAYYNSGVRHEISSCHPGTRETAIGTISDWIEDPGSHCLWLHGPAGTGKSVIAYTIAEKCRSGALEFKLGATYFFARGSTTNRPLLFFPTLAYQLALAVPDLRDPLRTMLYEDPTVLDRSMSEQLEALVIQPLLALSDRPAHIVIVIDGLDECDCTGGPAIQADIVRLILGLGKHSLPLRFIISSRPELEIRFAFRPSTCPRLTRLPLDNTMDPDRDIRHFLCDKLGQVHEECVKDGTLVAQKTAWPSSEAIEQLVSESSGHFIYASTVIRFVQEGHVNPVERLRVLLQISSKSTGPGAFAQSTAFQELDRLYLHILHNAGDPAELKWILRAIIYFGDEASVSNLEAIFSQISGIRFLLGNLRSVIEATESSLVRFFHASMNEFLLNSARSREFYLDPSQFEAGLVYEYARLIILFPLVESRGRRNPLTMALDGLTYCLKGTHAYPGLLSSTLEKISIAINKGPKSPLPCICYSGLDCLSRTLKGVPGSGGLRKTIKAFQRQLEPQLTELSGSIFTLLRVVGLCFAASLVTPGYSPSWVETSQLIGTPIGLEIFQRTLDLPPDRVLFRCSAWDWRTRRAPILEIHQSLSRWLRQPKGRWSFITTALGIFRPSPKTIVEKYTWTWAWDTAFVLRWGNGHLVHDLDLIFCCLRTLFLGITRPPKDVSEEKKLQFASRSIRYYSTRGRPRSFGSRSSPITQVIDFTSMSRALPTISTELYPRLFYFIWAFDHWEYRLNTAKRNSSLGHCLQTIYSHVLQDPIVSHAVSVLYAMFVELSAKDIELLLGVVPGELFHSPAMQALLGVGVLWEDDEIFKLPTRLLLLLRSGSVKLQHDAPNNDIGVCISNAHEDLAIACIEYILSCAEPLEQDGLVKSAGSYAMIFWKSHLTRAKHSERLFEVLKRVVVRKDDVELVIKWLEEDTDTPKDILLRWHAARLEHNTQIGVVPVVPVEVVRLAHHKVQWPDGMGGLAL